PSLADSPAPAGALTQPGDEETLSGTVTVASSAADGGSGLASVQFEVKGPGDASFSGLGAAVTTAPYEISWATSTVADGTYELRSVTRDVAGNRTTSAAHTVVVDNTAPTGALTQPADGARLRAGDTLAS